MNQAYYALLGSALVGLARKSGQRNKTKPVDIVSIENDLISKYKKLRKTRPDAILAAIYSFINFRQEGQDIPFLDSLTSIFNNTPPIELMYQPLFLMKYTLGGEIEFAKLAKAVDQIVVESFGGDRSSAYRAWMSSFDSLLGGYKLFFEENDQGLQYDFIYRSVFPDIINEETFDAFFKGSKKLILSENLSDEKSKDSINILYAAITRRQLDDDLFLTGNLSIENIFKSATQVLDAIRISDAADLVILKDQIPTKVIYDIVFSDPTTQGSNSYDLAKDFVVFDLTLRALQEIKQNLVRLNNAGNLKDIAEINESATYYDIISFFEERYLSPSVTMINMQMPHYRNDPIVSKYVPDEYVRTDGYIEQLWREYGTLTWSVATSIIRYLYGNQSSIEVDSLQNWEFGMKFSTRVFDALCKDTKAFSTESKVKSLIKKAHKGYRKQKIQKMLDKIKFGDLGKKDLHTVGFNPSDPQKNDEKVSALPHAIYDDGILEIRKGDDIPESLDFMGKHIGHCRTVSDPNSEIYGVFYRGYPFYTVQVLSSGEIVQFKGLRNRVMGSESSAEVTSNPRIDRDLLREDVKNVSRFIAEVKKVTPNLSIGEKISRSDFMLIDVDNLSLAEKQQTLRVLISSLV